jgi:hypothetical protein
MTFKVGDTVKFLLPRSQYAGRNLMYATSRVVGVNECLDGTEEYDLENDLCFHESELELVNEHA